MECRLNELRTQIYSSISYALRRILLSNTVYALHKQEDDFIAIIVIDTDSRDICRNTAVSYTIVVKAIS